MNRVLGIKQGPSIDYVEPCSLPVQSVFCFKAIDSQIMQGGGRAQRWDILQSSCKFANIYIYIYL